MSTLCWFDLPVHDLERAIKFYEKVLNIILKKEVWGDMEMAVFPHKDTEIGGCLYKHSLDQPSDHGILVYFSVNGRMNLALEEAEKSGGKILKPRHPIGPFGYRAILLDTEGNRIALHSVE